MKRFVPLGGLILALAVCATAAFAQVKHTESDGSVSYSGGASDSSSFTIFQRTDAQRVADTGPKDTTGWYGPLSQASLTPCQFAGQSLVKIQLNVSGAASTDSIGYVEQYSFSPDRSVIFSKAKAYVVGTGPYVVTAMICDTNANEPAYGALWVRFIYSDEDQSQTASWPSATVKWAATEAR